jgi:hypothetical protein
MNRLRRSLAAVASHFDLFNVICVLSTLAFVLVYFPKQVQQTITNGAKSMITTDSTAVHKVGNWGSSFRTTIYALDVSAQMSCPSSVYITKTSFYLTMYALAGNIVAMEGTADKDMKELLSVGKLENTNCSFSVESKSISFNSQLLLSANRSSSEIGLFNEKKNYTNLSPIFFFESYFRPIKAIQSAVPVVLGSASKILEGNIFTNWKDILAETIHSSKVVLLGLKDKIHIHDYTFWDVCNHFFDDIQNSYLDSISEYEIIQRSVETDIEFLFRVSSYTLIVDIIFSLAIIYKEFSDLRKSKHPTASAEAPTVPVQSDVEM